MVEWTLQYWFGRSKCLHKSTWLIITHDAINIKWEKTANQICDCIQVRCCNVTRCYPFNCRLLTNWTVNRWLLRNKTVLSQIIHHAKYFTVLQQDKRNFERRQKWTLYKILGELAVWCLYLTKQYQEQKNARTRFVSRLKSKPIAQFNDLLG